MKGNEQWAGRDHDFSFYLTRHILSDILSWKNRKLILVYREKGLRYFEPLNAI